MDSGAVWAMQNGEGQRGGTNTGWMVGFGFESLDRFTVKAVAPSQWFESANGNTDSGLFSPLVPGMPSSIQANWSRAHFSPISKKKNIKIGVQMAMAPATNQEWRPTKRI